MPFSRCQDVMARVSEIVDGEAGAGARARFFAHMAMCSDCRRYYRQLRDVCGAAAATADEPPANLDAMLDRVMEAVDAAHSDPS